MAALTKQPIREGFRLQKLIKAPFMIAILLGLLLFLTQAPLPAVVSGCLPAVAELNTPMVMFTIGIYLAQTDILRMIRKPSLYLVSLVRLLVIPLLSLCLLAAVPESLRSMKMALLLAAACPVGSNVAVYAQLHGKDYPYAVETVVISTLFSILTMPLIARLASAVW